MSSTYIYWHRYADNRDRTREKSTKLYTPKNKKNETKKIPKISTIYYNIVNTAKSPRDLGLKGNDNIVIIYVCEYV